MRTPNPRLPRVLLALPVALLAACGGSTDEDKLVCDAPPADLCDDDRLISYAPTGTEVDGECVYEATSTTCAAGCEAAACLPTDPSCDGVTCDEPPASACDGEIAVSYADEGVCSDGDCSYDEVREDCRDSGQSCREGACVSVGDPCDGVFCDEPPAASCDDDGNVLTWSDAGVCDDGECTYTPTSTPCDEGFSCDDGACVPDAEDLCEDVVCDAPPAASCDDDGAVVSYDADGECNPATGVCVYVQSITDCDPGFSCDGGACVEDVITDPCDGIVCDAPPATACLDADTLRAWADTGTCDDGDCTYVSTDTPCGEGFTCETDACVEDDVTDPCDGIVCDDPPATACLDADTLRAWADTGTCDDGDCTYVSTDTPCGEGFTCETDACVEDDVTDPCDGIVCDDPPTAFCYEGVVATNFSASGTCVDERGSPLCTYEPITETCSIVQTCELTEPEPGLFVAGCVDPPPAIAVGDLIFTEVMYDPSGIDNNREWFELHNRTSSPIDLNGFVFGGNVTGDAFEIDRELVIPAGGYVVFANGADAIEPAEPDFVATNFVLANTRDFIELYLPGGETRIARVSWDESPSDGLPATDNAIGSSLQLDAALVSTADDDDRAGWCLASNVYRPTSLDLGTPGAPNTDCSCAGVVCVDFGGDCEDRSEDGSFSWAVRPVDSVCVEGTCDTTTAVQNCASIDLACSFGQCVSPSELPMEGNLHFNEFLANPAGVDSGYEFMELRNSLPGTLNLRGVRISNERGEAFVIDEDHFVAEGEVAILAAGPDVPGPLARYEYAGDAAFTLMNGSDVLILSMQVQGTTVELDRVAYDVLTGWDLPEGTSIGLADSLPNPAQDNDDPTSWCRQNSDEEWGFGNFGTPGLENLECGGGDDPRVGAVIFTEIMARSRSGAGDPGEFIELYNTTTEAFDLSGCNLLIGDTSRLIFPTEAVLAAESFVVVGNSTDPLTNLGNGASYAFSGALSNSGFTFELECGGTSIDSGAIGSGAAGSLGRSWQLLPTAFDYLLNDLAANWCSSSTAPVYNDDNPDALVRGTPGAMTDCGD